MDDKGEHMYQRFGAEKVCGIKLFVYQQFLRYAHLVPTEVRPAPESDDHDKCYFCRPLITLLQDAFMRWLFPGKNNGVDEAGVPSRFR